MLEVLSRPGPPRATQMLEEDVRPAVDKNQEALDELG